MYFSLRHYTPFSLSAIILLHALFIRIHIICLIMWYIVPPMKLTLICTIFSRQCYQDGFSGVLWYVPMVKYFIYYFLSMLKSSISTHFSLIHFSLCCIHWFQFRCLVFVCIFTCVSLTTSSLLTHLVSHGHRIMTLKRNCNVNKVKRRNTR